MSATISVRSRRSARSFSPSAKALLAVALLALTICSPGQPAPAADISPTSDPSTIVQSKPVTMSVDPQSATGGSVVTSSISVDATGGSIQVGCDRPDLAASPTGSWPYTVSYPTGGSTTQTQSYATAPVSSTSAVHFYTCPAGVDISNSSNWSTYTTLTLTP